MRASAYIHVYSIIFYQYNDAQLMLYKSKTLRKYKDTRDPLYHYIILVSIDLIASVFNTSYIYSFSPLATFIFLTTGMSVEGSLVTGVEVSGWTDNKPALSCRIISQSLRNRHSGVVP